MNVLIHAQFLYCEALPSMLKMASVFILNFVLIWHFPLTISTLCVNAASLFITAT